MIEPRWLRIDCPFCFAPVGKNCCRDGPNGLILGCSPHEQRMRLIDEEIAPEYDPAKEISMDDWVMHGAEETVRRMRLAQVT